MFGDDPLDMSSMARLSVGALETLLSKTSIVDVKQISFSAPLGPAGDPIRAACDNRTSTASYLQKNFGHGTLLLDAMSRHQAYLSGSRSLEFFVPGRLGPTSDWDFYLPRRQHVVCSFMQALSHMGVSWQSSIQQVEAAISNGRGEVLFAALQYSYHCDNGDFHNLASRHGISLSQMVDVPFHLPKADLGQFTSPWIVVSISARSLQAKHWKPEDVEEGHAEMYRRIGSVINGYITRPEGEVKVQLILEDRWRRFDCPAIMKYHSSCVQSVISPHLACHFYGKLTSQSMSYGWRHDKRSEEAQEKYRGRGFFYLPRDPACFQLRMGDDDESVLVYRDSPTDAPDDVVKLYQESVKKMSWQELARDIVELPPVVNRYVHTLQYSGDKWLVRSCEARLFMALVHKGVLPCFI